MIYKIKGFLLLVFLAECKACCRSLCSWQERRLIIFKMKGRILKTPLWDAPGWLQSGLQEWWASSLIFFSWLFAFIVWKGLERLYTENLNQAEIRVFINWISSCFCWGSTFSHCHCAFHSTLIWRSKPYISQSWQYHNTKIWPFAPDLTRMG